MPTDQKLRIAHQPGPDPQRGFSSVGSESSSKLYRQGLLKNQKTEELSDARVRKHRLRSFEVCFVDS